MKELISIFVLSFLFVYANAQDAYFSSQPLVAGEIPDKSTTKTQFTDQDFIYGMIHFEKNLKDLGISNTSNARTEDGVNYQYATLDLSFQFGNIPVAMMKGRAYSQPIIEINGESYWMLTILPNPKDCYYMNKFPECMKNLYADGMVSATQNMIIKSFEYGELKFSTKLKITRKKSNDEGKAFLLSLRSDCYDNKLNFDNDRIRADDAEDNMSVTYEKVEVKLEGGFAPGSSCQIQLRTKKSGEDFSEWTSQWKGFEFSGTGCSIKNGTVVIDPLPFGTSLNEEFTLKVQNKFNSACNATITNKLDYAGEYYFNYSGSNGRKGAQKEPRGENGGDGLDAYDLDVFVSEYKENFVLVKFVWAKNGATEVYMFKKEGSKLNVINRGGNGGGAGMGRGPGRVDGNGGAGGNGGAVTIHISPNIKSYASHIIVDNRGGDGGYKIAGNSGSPGKAGQSGPVAKIVTENVKIEVPQ